MDASDSHSNGDETAGPDDATRWADGTNRSDTATASDGYKLSADLLLRAINAADNMICVVDMQAEDQPLVFVNEYFCEHLGYDRTEIIGRNCRFLQCDGEGGRDTEQPGLDKIREALAEGRSCSVQLRNYFADGEQFINELFLSPVHDADGTLTHFVGVQNDVTGRARLQTQLRRQTLRLRTAIDAVPSMVGLVRWKNDRWEHVVVSKRLATYLEITEQDALGKSFEEIGYPPALAERLDELCQRDDGRQCGQIKRVREDVEIEGEVRTLEIKTDCFQVDRIEPSFEELLLNLPDDLDIGEEDVDLWAYTVEDVTDWLRTTRELNDVQRRFVDVQSAEQRRIARDLHDGSAQEVLALELQTKAMAEKYRRSDELPEAVVETLLAELKSIQETAARANARMRRAIQGLLPAEIESVGLTQALARLVDEACSAMAATEDGDSACRLEIVSRVAVPNHDQAMQLYRIVAEATANARRHSQSPTILVRIGSPDGRDVSRPGERAFVEIVDTGIGFDPQMIDDRRAGLGLQSMSVRAIRVDGYLSIRTEVGQGTTVRCDFTLASPGELNDEEDSRIEFLPEDAPH